MSEGQYDAKFGQVYRHRVIPTMVVMVIANVETLDSPDYRVIYLTGGDEWDEIDLWGLFHRDWEPIDV